MNGGALVLAVALLLVLAWTGRDVLFENQTYVQNNPSQRGIEQQLAQRPAPRQSELLPVIKRNSAFKVSEEHKPPIEPHLLDFLGKSFDRDIHSAFRIQKDSAKLSKHKIFVYDLPFKFNGAMVNKADMAQDLLNYDLRRNGAIPRPKQEYCKLERLMHGLMQQQNPLVEKNISEAAEEAVLFFVPVYPVHHCAIQERAELIQNVKTHEASKTRVSDELTGVHFECGRSAQKFMLEAKDWVAQHYPFWNASGGADHVFMTFYDFGPCMEHEVIKAAERGVPDQLNKSIFLTPYGSHAHSKVSKACSAKRNVVVPPLTAAEAFHPLASPSPNKTIYVYFRGSTAEIQKGTSSRELRLSLCRDLLIPGKVAGTKGSTCPLAFKADSKQCFVRGLPVISSNIFVSGETYADEMRKAIFCLAPPGFAKWTFRFFEAILAGCIPVVYDDGESVLPYEDAIDYSQMIVRIPSADASNTLIILSKIPEARVKTLREQGATVRGLLAYQRDLGKRGTSGFHPVLYELMKRVK
jgi:hypothetical protein